MKMRKLQPLDLPHAGVMRFLQVLLLGALLLRVCTAHARIVPLGPAVQVTEIAGREEQCPQVVALPDGGFVVAWEAGDDPYAPTAFGRRFGTAGEALAPEFRFEGVMGHIAVAGSVNGLALSWGGQSNLTLKEFTVHGIPSGIVQSVEGTMGIFDAFALIATPQKEFVLVWNPFGPTLVGQRFDRDLSPTGPTFVVAPDPNGQFPVCPGIAATADGGFVAAWIDEPLSNSLAVLGRQFDAQNIALAEPFAVVDPGELSEPTARPSVCVEDSGNFVVAWQDIDHPTEFRRYNAQAQPL